MLSKVLVPVGIVLIVFGFVFQFQGIGQLGPESSFMYQNDDWIRYGIIIIISGVIAVSSGVFLFLKNKS
jgi:uncharacterized membrane protein